MSLKFAPIVFGTDDETPLTKSEARTLTTEIRFQVGKTWAMIQTAYLRRAWSALGYKSWDEYCTTEFDGSRLRLPREERQEVVVSLREAGLSLRAIASATGHSVNTVRKELDEVYQSDTPDEVVDAEVVEAPGGLTADSPGQSDRVAAALTKARGAEATPITGVDGKTYRQREVPRPPSKPRRGPITEDFGRAANDLTRITNRIEKLSNDDRFIRDAESLQNRLSDLVRARIAIDNTICKLDPDCFVNLSDYLDGQAVEAIRAHFADAGAVR